MKNLYSFLFCCLLVSVASAQETKSLLNVFLAPENYEFLRSEVRFVNFVSDRHLSDIQCLVVSEPVSNGSVRFMHIFIGYGTFEGQNDTIIWHVDPGENEGSIREKNLLAFRQGLLRYILQTPLASAISYEVDPAYNHYDTPDRWDRWTFKPGIFLYGNNAYAKDSDPLSDTIETRNGAFSLRPNFSFWRISDQWRVSGGLEYSYFQTWRHSPIKEDEYAQKQSFLNLRISAVYSLASRWSLGTGFSRSQNWDSQQPPGLANETTDRLKIGIEHNFFPYKQYFRRSLVVGYTWGFTFGDGNTQKVSDVFFRNHQIYGAYTKIDRWGYIAADIAANYDHIPDQWTHSTLKSNVKIAFNVGKNIYTTLTMNGSWINHENDLNSFGGLPTSKSRKQQYAQISYSFGLDYYFGSGYRNVVNPRLYSSDQFF